MRILRELWNHVVAQDSAEQPAVVFGGDFNNTRIQWIMCFQSMMKTQASRRTLQMCTSKTIPLHGDSAVAINVHAQQETSGHGISWNNDAFSDAHDVVLVLLSWSSAAQPAVAVPARTAVAAQPAVGAASSTSADPAPTPPPTAQPKREPETKPSAPANTKSSSSAAQPAWSTSADPGPLPPRTPQPEGEQEPQPTTPAATYNDGSAAQPDQESMAELPHVWQAEDHIYIDSAQMSGSDHPCFDTSGSDNYTPHRFRQSTSAEK